MTANGSWGLSPTVADLDACARAARRPARADQGRDATRAPDRDAAPRGLRADDSDRVHVARAGSRVAGAARQMTMEPVPDDWERALAIVAHPDDMEYGAAAAVAHWTARGQAGDLSPRDAGRDRVSTTSSPDECARVREAEERASAAIVGVDTVEFLDHPDGLIEYGMPLRRDLALAIRRHRPEVVDHAQPPRDVGRRAPQHGRPPPRRARRARRGARRGQPVAVPRPTTGRERVVGRALRARRRRVGRDALRRRVRTSSSCGIASLEAHARYLEHVGTDAREFLTSIAEQVGHGRVRYAPRSSSCPMSGGRSARSSGSWSGCGCRSRCPADARNGRRAPGSAWSTSRRSSSCRCCSPARRTRRCLIAH